MGPANVTPVPPGPCPAPSARAGATAPAAQRPPRERSRWITAGSAAAPFGPNASARCEACDSHPVTSLRPASPSPLHVHFHELRAPGILPLASAAPWELWRGRAAAAARTRPSDHTCSSTRTGRAPPHAGIQTLPAPPSPMLPSGEHHALPAPLSRHTRVPLRRGAWDPPQTPNTPPASPPPAAHRPSHSSWREQLAEVFFQVKSTPCS